MTSPVPRAEVPLWKRPFDDLLAQAVGFHGHLCPGQVLGVRLTMAGCREVDLGQPREAGKTLVVFVEIDRCATDAVQALTGVSLGKRTLRHLDYGKAAATFVNVSTGTAVRVVARDEARLEAADWAPHEPTPRRAQAFAYRVMPDDALFRIEPVTIQPGWLDRRRVRVFCAVCREGINYQREVDVAGRALCRPCSGESYYTRWPLARAASLPGSRRVPDGAPGLAVSASGAGPHEDRGPSPRAGRPE